MAPSSEQRMESKPQETPAKERRSVAATGAPGWGLPAYLIGLALIYVGERIVGVESSSRWALSGSGLALTTVATVARLISSSSAPPARRKLERWLGAFSLLGLASLGLYFAGAEWLIRIWEDGSAGPDAAARNAGILTSVWVSLLGLSVLPLVFGETALRPMRSSVRPELGRARTALTAGAVLALATTYVVLFVYTVAAQGWKVDYSYFKTSRPGESTQNIVKALKQPLKVYAFFPAVNEVKSEVLGYFEELSRASGGKVTVESHDRLLSPKFSRKYRVSRDGTVVFVKGDTDVSFYIGSDIEDARPKLKTLDETVQKNLLQVAREMRVAYLTVGHGELGDPGATAQGEEQSGTIVKQLLSALGYKTKVLGLAEGLGSEVPSNATIVVVLGPSEPFAPEELDTLERYASRGGKLLLALDPRRASSGTSLVEAGDAAVNDAEAAVAAEDRPAESPQPSAVLSAQAPASVAEPGAPAAGGAATPGATAGEGARNEYVESLGRLAAIAGVRIDPGQLASETNHLQRRFNDSDRVLLVTNNFSSHAAVSTLSRNATRGAAVGLFGASSLSPLPGTQKHPDFSIKTLHDVFRDEDGNYRKDPDEPKGSFNVAAALSIPLGQNSSEPEEPKKPTGGAKDGSTKENEQGIPKEGRVFVVADADGFSDFVLGRSRTQQFMLADVIRWLGGEESFSGAVSSEKDVPIEHTRDQDVAWFYSTIFGVPVFVLVVGLIGSRRRSRRGGKR